MRAYERLLKYARVYTTSDPNSGTHPSAEREFDLAHILVEDMKAIGIEDAFVDEHCYVYGTLPATPGCEDKPALGLIAHMDTAPDASGENVNPILHENYDGCDVTLPATGMVMKVSTFPFLKDLKGETLITTDGTTLLGADDKAGVAEIMDAVQYICSHPEFRHGEVCIAFTPDEEIGRGVDNFDTCKFGADYAYTMDGGEVGELEFENFNASSAKVLIQGRNVHPGYAKGKMLNAIRIAEEFDALLPQDQKPEYTSNYEGFLHLTSFKGTVEQAELSYIIRDHDSGKLEQKKKTLRQCADFINSRYGEQTAVLKISDQYRNMREMVEPHYHIVEKAQKAMMQAGVEPRIQPIRGGTDGANLSFKGLPCPNIFAGGLNFHGKFEWTSVENMQKASQVILNIISLFAEA